MKAYATLATLVCYSNKNEAPLQIQLKVKAYGTSFYFLWCFQLLHTEKNSLSLLKFWWNLKIIVIIENHEIFVFFIRMFLE